MAFVLLLMKGQSAAQLLCSMVLVLRIVASLLHRRACKVYRAQFALRACMPAGADSYEAKETACKLP